MAARKPISTTRSKVSPNVAYADFRQKATTTARGTTVTPGYRPGQEVLDDAAALGSTVAATDASGVTTETSTVTPPSFGSFTTTVNDPADPNTKVGFGLMQMLGLPDTIWVSADTGIPLDYPLAAAAAWYGSKWLGWR